MSALRWLSRTLGTWPGALLATFVLAAVVLLGGISASGLWDPQERTLADKSSPPLGDPAPTATPTTPAPKPVTPPAPPADGCYHTAPPDPTARSLTPKAMAWGRDTLGDSDGGRRLPFALLGLLLVLASTGIAIRLAGARAGLVAACVLLAMPLCTLQARFLTSEIGTPTGAALIIYGFVAIATLDRRAAWRTSVDALVAVASIALGTVLAFAGGGALLGVAVPLLAVGVAGSFGATAVAAVRARRPVLPELPAVIATILAGAVLGVLAYQTFSLKPVVPGLTPPPARELFGHAFIPTGCWSSALGGLWKPDDDLRIIYDSAFEQIAYGTFPWGVLAPLACAALLGGRDRNARRLGALTLAWAAGSWLATEVFARKVGFTIFAGFPAMAIAIGAWVDSLFAKPAPDQPSSVPVGAPLIAVFALLAMLDLGRDLQGFPEKLTSILTGTDIVPYPKMAELLGIGMKVWVLAIGLLIAVVFGLAVVSRTLAGKHWRTIARWSAPAAIGLTVLTAAFWSFAWEGKLGEHLSVKALFDTYKELRAPGDQLVIMGDLGRAPHFYADTVPELVPDRPKVVAALGRPNRVFAILPQTEICPLHREMAHKPYFVLDDRNLKHLLISNKVDGTTDKNPLAHEILHEEPTDIPTRPKDKDGKPARIVFDNKIELLGWRVPSHAARGSSIEITLYFKVLGAPGGAWSVLGHFDSPGLRFNGDHKPIEDHCGTNTWQTGDYIVDTFTVKAASGPFAKGAYEFRTGFFTGGQGNFKNMAVTVAPANLRDSTDRVFVTTINVD
ncbi:MAG TPA: hypothetical protein VGM88_05665 [Kofleriaceae bacterium]|jgi:hypothetical protein